MNKYRSKPLNMLVDSYLLKNSIPLLSLAILLQSIHLPFNEFLEIALLYLISSDLSLFLILPCYFKVAII